MGADSVGLQVFRQTCSMLPSANQNLGLVAAWGLCLLRMRLRTCKRPWECFTSTAAS